MLKKGNLIDLFQREIYPAALSIEKGRVVNIERISGVFDSYILPGFIDAHVHVESSMLVPSEFAAAAVKHGTVGTVSDPHEIANVMGMEGIRFMMENGKSVPFKFYFGAPPCVPATEYESSGAVIGLEDLDALLSSREINYMSEMMNYPGVIYGDDLVMDKLKIAAKHSKPVDGHAPGIVGDDLKRYIAAGITTDHEAFSLEEALEKISLGMKILIREGSAARNLEALAPLFKLHPDMVMLCNDDIHPEMLEKRHMDGLVKQAINSGYDLYDVLRASSVNTVEHYKLDIGLLRVGDHADFVVVKDLDEFKTIETWINGGVVYSDNKVRFSRPEIEILNSFNSSRVSEDDIKVTNLQRRARVIELKDGELYTTSFLAKWSTERNLQSSVKKDILKLVVKDRYNDLPASVAFINGFGIKEGAMASSVAHDSHNIIAVGVDDRSITEAINAIVEEKGGLAICNSNGTEIMSLPVAGIMSNVPCGTIANKYTKLSEKVKIMGSHLKAPFMTLSFMALLVIPELKLGDKGLFDGIKFQFTDLFEKE